MGPDARPAVPALLKALRDGPNDYNTGDGTIGTRSRIAWALGEIDDPAAIPGLIDALKNAEPWERGYGAINASRLVAARGAIAKALGTFGPRARNAAPALMDMLRDGRGSGHGDPEYAAWALGRIGATESIPLLIELLAHRDNTATLSAEALGMLAPASQDAVGPLSQIVLDADRDRVTRWRAAEALGKIADVKSIRVLAQALKDSTTAHQSAKALATFGPLAEPVMGEMIAFLKKPSGAVIDRKSGSIHYAGDSSSLHSARIVLIRLLEKINSPQAFDALVPLLPDPELANTSVVFKALLRMDPEGSKTKPVFAELSRSEDPVARWVGVRGLGKLKDTEVIPDLVARLRDEDCKVRDAAIRSLCGHGNAEASALPVLIEISRQEDRCRPGLVDKAIRKIGKTQN
jgi:HEAT repeat protein